MCWWWLEHVLVVVRACVGGGSGRFSRRIEPDVT